MSLDAGLGYLDSKDVADFRSPFAPKFTGNVSLNTRQPLAVEWFAIAVTSTIATTPRCISAETRPRVFPRRISWMPGSASRATTGGSWRSLATLFSTRRG